MYSGRLKFRFGRYRSQFNCSVDWPVPLAHRKCYRRHCEPLSDASSKDKCPFEPGPRFSGRYCRRRTFHRNENFEVHSVYESMNVRVAFAMVSADHSSSHTIARISYLYVSFEPCSLMDSYVIYMFSQCSPI